MPRGLAIETSGRLGSVAVVDDDVVVAEETFPHGLKHAAGIVPIIDRLTRERGWSPREVEQLYVSIGPGSFTGLRIGVTLAKTIAFATGAKMVTVPSLAVIARNAPAEARHVIVVLDAKREQIFTARFERGDGDSDEWIEREPAHLDSLASIVARAPRPVHLLGEGIPFHEKFIPKGDAGVIVTPEASWRARAAVVAQIGVRLATEGRFADPFVVTPIYVRKPEAEEKYEQTHGISPSPSWRGQG
jgi:tRNA threonylcarbamoyladenosine biosynthesis protein TsaB